jgi:hypothetical protein
MVASDQVVPSKEYRILAAFEPANCPSMTYLPFKSRTDRTEERSVLTGAEATLQELGAEEVESADTPVEENALSCWPEAMTA